MKGLICLLLLAAGLAASSNAKADNWVLCGTCTTEADLVQAAKNVHGLSKVAQIYAVANPNNLIFGYVQVQYSESGIEPVAPASRTATAPTDAKAIRGTTKAGVSYVGVLSTAKVRTTADTEALLAAAGGQVYAYSITPTEVERQQFEAIARISKTQVLIKPDNQSGYFTNFRVGYYDSRSALDSAVLIALTANNPLWQYGPLSGIWEALKGFWGKGPVGCVVFANGDSACFQINPLAPGAIRVLEGTAVTVDGAPIDPGDPQSLPNGSGVSVTPQLNVPNYGDVTFLTGNDPNGPKIQCVMVNNFAQQCRVVFH